ncbi:putative ribonuclease H-like domain-containing protein [Tanacetum coccineum]
MEDGLHTGRSTSKKVNLKNHKDKKAVDIIRLFINGPRGETGTSWHRFYCDLFPLVPVDIKYIFVAVDYLSKWVEAKVLPTNDARVVVKFLKSLFARFGNPHAIISDRGNGYDKYGQKDKEKDLNRARIGNVVLDLEKTKTTQHNEFASLKRRVKKLEKKSRSRTHKMKRLYKVGLTARVESFGDEDSLGEDASKQRRINAIDADEEITLVSAQDDADKEMFDVDALNGEEVFVARKNENVVEEVVDVAQVSTVATTVTITTEEITLAQALEALKTSKPKVKGIVFQEPGKSTTTTTISSQQSQDKGKGIMIEEPVKPMKKKDQISFDEETALKLQAEFDEEERLAREKAEKEKEANIALIETWDDIQAKIDVDYQLAERLQAQEQEELSDAEKATLFQQLLEKRRKHFAAKRAEEKRNKPPTKAQQKKIMCTYLKNMEGYKLNDLKLKDFDSIQEMFDRAFKRVNTFEDFRTELVEGKEKRAGTELIHEIIKKQNVEDDKETTELKKLMEIIPDEEEVEIDTIPLVVKSPSIVDWKIHKEGRKSYYQIIRADGKSQIYMFFSQMLKNFDRKDLEDLYKLVKAKYKSTRPVEDLDLVHSLRMQHMQIYMLVEKKYPLAPLTLLMMLEKKLNIDYESEIAYQLLKLIIKQLLEGKVVFGSILRSGDESFK